MFLSCSFLGSPPSFSQKVTTKKDNKYYHVVDSYPGPAFRYNSK